MLQYGKMTIVGIRYDRVRFSLKQMVSKSVRRGVIMDVPSLRYLQAHDQLSMGLRRRSRCEADATTEGKEWLKMNLNAGSGNKNEIRSAMKIFKNEERMG